MLVANPIFLKLDVPWVAVLTASSQTGRQLSVCQAPLPKIIKIIYFDFKQDHITARFHTRVF